MFTNLIISNKTIVSSCKFDRIFYINSSEIQFLVNSVDVYSNMRAFISQREEHKLSYIYLSWIPIDPLTLFTPVLKKSAMLNSAGFVWTSSFTTAYVSFIIAKNIFYNKIGRNEIFQYPSRSKLNTFIHRCTPFILSMQITY